MKLFNKIPIEFDGKSYEVRVLYDETAINVVAFLNNHPANGFRYQVKLSKRADIHEILKRGPVDELVEICRKDILEKKWENWRLIIHKNITG